MLNQEMALTTSLGSATSGYFLLNESNHIVSIAINSIGRVTVGEVQFLMPGPNIITLLLIF